MDEKLLKILACPKCQGDLELLKEESVLVCQKCKTVYQVVDNIPVLLPEKGTPFDEWEKSKK